MNNSAIGMFDSGIGGLTVYRALKSVLPEESVIYLGDTARLPYGSKSAASITRFSEENTSFLLGFGVKLVVVACNSSSAHAVHYLRQHFKVPVVGVIEPGAMAAAAMPGKRIGIIGTNATVASGAYEKAIHELRREVEIVSHACPLFVPLVEEGWLDHPATRLVAAEYLAPLRQAQIETLVLGCTHYPLLRSIIEEYMGTAVRLVDSAAALAAEVKRLLAVMNLSTSESTAGSDSFFVTDFPERFQRVGEIFLDRKIPEVSLAQLPAGGKNAVIS